jgi:hypothetical protein
MTDRIDTLLKSLAETPFPGPSKQAVLQRGHRRRLRARVATSVAVVVLLAGGTATMATLQREAGRSADRPASAPGVVGTLRSPAGYPASFLAVRALGAHGGIAQMDSTTGKVKRYLTGRDTVSPAIAGGNLYYLRGVSGCSKVYRQPLAGGIPRQVATGKFAGVDQLVSDGHQRLAWLGCLLPGKQYGFWEGKVLHVEDTAGGQPRDVKADLAEFGISSLAVGSDGRLAVIGQTTTHQQSSTERDVKGKPMVVSVLHDVMYVVDPAKTDRLSAGHRLTPPAGCHFAAAGWHGTDLTAAVSCRTGNQADGSAHDKSRLVTISGRTLQVTKTLAELGPGDVFSMTVARNGATLAVMGNGAGIGPVPRVVNGSVALLPGIAVCLPDKPCADYFESPVWLE